MTFQMLPWALGSFRYAYIKGFDGAVGDRYDRSFDFEIKSSSASTLVKDAAGVEKGSGVPHTQKVGSITSDALSGTMDLTDLAFADNKLSFKFDSGQYGVLDLNVTVDGNSFNGAISVPGIGEMPVTGSKKMGDM